MAEKKNQLKSKEAPKKEASKKAKKSKPKKDLFKGVRTKLQVLWSEKMQKVYGLGLLLFAATLMIAFTSFFFTWQSDQDKVMPSQNEIGGETMVQVDNWFGSVGASLSHTFIHEWFGIASFFFVFLFFLAGFRILFKVSLLPLRKTFRYSFFGLIWLSIALAFLFKSDNFHMGGAFGYHINIWLNSVLGAIGTGIFLFFAASVFVIVAFDPSIAMVKGWFGKKAEELPENLDPEITSEADFATVNTIREEDIIREDAVQEAVNLSPTPEPDVASEFESQVIEVFEKAEMPEVPEPEMELSTPTEVEPQADATPEVETEEEGNAFDLEIEDAAPAPAPAPETELTLETVVAETEPTLEEVEEGGLEVLVPEADEELTKSELKDKLKEFGEYDPTLDLSAYKLPPVDLLNNYGDNNITVNPEELEENKNKIIETLRNYKIEISKIKATIGPTVTLYEIVPAPGVRISKIKNLEDDIALSLAALGIRIIAPIPGKGTIGIEVPNSNPDIVSMRTVIAADKFQNTKMALPVALGKTISNETFTADLAKMPHLLMAGATGQGKSVGLNAILVSLLYKKHPAQVKFVLVDPKKVELTLFNKIERHFLAKLPDVEEPIITDTSKVVTTLNSLCVEMDARYELLKNAQVRNIIEYNAKFIERRLNPEHGHKYLPYIVLVVDEFADLIMTAGKEVEQPIARLAQLARAIGIHLIIATQRPSVNIITGTIKANFPARIAFRVTSKIDSRTILDAGGADQLIGRGDMLYSTGNDLIRLQCAFVDTPEVEQICDMIGVQRGYPSAFLLPEYVEEGGESSGPIVDEDRDAKFEDAARIVVLHQQGSASLLQRKLKLGYNRAGRIVDQLEAAGIIGPFEGSKARKVLYPDEYSLEQFLNAEAAKGNEE